MTTETKTMLIVLVASIIILAGGAALYQRSSNQPDSPDTLTTNQEALVRENSIKISATGEEKLVVVEFADYQCPACGYIAPQIKLLMEQYKENVTFVFRDFPLSNIHRNAVSAASTARIAGEQGKYWEMHELLFAKQGEWSIVSDPSDLFVQYASSLGMDTSEIKNKLSSKAYQKEIEQDLADARILGVDSTPTFFVGDVIIRTANANLIKETIDAKLAE